jgi:HSP20 family protein
MTLVKFNHQAPRQLNQWVNRFLDEDLLADRFFGGFPPVNIFDNNDNYSIEVAAPGLDKNDFKVQLDRNLLSISVEKKETVENNDSREIRREFSHRGFKRSFTLDDKIDADNIVAKYENGVLRLTLPKREEVKSGSKDIAIL